MVSLFGKVRDAFGAIFISDLGSRPAPKKYTPPRPAQVDPHQMLHYPTAPSADQSPYDQQAVWFTDF